MICVAERLFKAFMITGTCFFLVRELFTPFFFTVTLRDRISFVVCVGVLKSAKKKARDTRIYCISMLVLPLVKASLSLCAPHPATAIKACGRNAAAALELLEQSREASTADVFAFATAVSVCGKGGRWAEAIALLDTMETDGILPDRACFNAALAGCARSGRPAEAHALIERMAACSLPPTSSSYTACARASLQCGDRHGAFAALDSIRHAGLPMDWQALQVELTANEGLLTSGGDEEGARSVRKRIGELVRDSLRLHRANSLRRSDVTWLWRLYSRTTLDAVRSSVVENVDLPQADAEATSQLLASLSTSASSGEMPCFDDERALVGYTWFNMVNRAGKMADVLRDVPPEWLRTRALESSQFKGPIISLGGGPAYDFAAVAILQAFEDMEQADATASEPVRVHVLDFAPGWEGVARAVSAAVVSELGDVRHQMTFGHCDLTKPLESTSNTAVRALLPESRLLVCSYVIAENAKRLQATEYAFFAELLEKAAPGALLAITETTHRQFPELIAAARRGVATAGDSCALEVSLASIRGQGGSQCLLFKRPRNAGEQAAVAATRSSSSSTELQLELCTERNRAHRRSHRVHGEQNRPSR